MPVSSAGRPLAKPPVRKYAKDRGVDLAQVPGSGADGIISREDVDAFLSGGSAQGAEQASAPTGTGAGAPAPSRAQAEREVRIPV